MGNKTCETCRWCHPKRIKFDNMEGTQYECWYYPKAEIIAKIYDCFRDTTKVEYRCSEWEGIENAKY